MDINIDTGKALLVIGLTILGVVLINLAIYYSVRGRGTIHQIELMRKAVGRARNPWSAEDSALQELASLVSQLHDRSNDSPSETAPGEEKKGFDQ